MKIQPFELERWQSIWEHKVELNISESGVEPLRVEELVDDPEILRRILKVRLGYPQTNGSEGLRSRIAELYPGARAENVLLTCGSAEANFLCTWALLEPGDEVVFMEPNYLQIAGLVEAFGGTVKPLWLKEELQWAPDLDDLARLVTTKTRFIAICNPNNPTGAILSAKAMDAVVAAASRVGAWIVTDEVYRGAELDGQMTPSFWGKYDRVLATGGLSKAFGLAGLRTGWVVGPAEMIERLWSYHDYASMAPAMLTDHLASLALEPARRSRLLERTRNILLKNYPVLRDWAKRHAGLITHIPPRAGAIAWFGVRGGRDTAAMAEELRVRKGVLLVPGEQLGMGSYFRIGFGGDAGTLERALARVDEVLARAVSA
ncbi:MAG: aminotransferase class I/II-fold pyridoxal phosphate-dependent enzyme [Candidatus Acidiferrales bacterium]